MKTFLLAIVTFLLVNFCFAQSVVVYPPPTAGFAKGSSLYLVSVTQGGVTQQSPVYLTTAGSGPSSEWGNEQGRNLHFTTFSFSGTVTITVTKINSTAFSANARPSRVVGLGLLNTSVQGTNRTVSFSISKPAKLSVEFADDPAYNNPLMIFADTLETNIPSIAAANVYVATGSSTASSLASIPSTKTVVYFPVGVYNLGGQWTIPNTVKQIYVAGGAYIIGYLYRSNTASNLATNNIMINGRGVLSNEGFLFHYPAAASDGNAADWYYTICLRGGTGNVIEGVTIIEATSFEIFVSAPNSLIQNVNINGFRYNNDGVTIQGSGNTINNCFMRLNEDGIVPYTTNLTISNCSFWQLRGTMIQLGWSPHSMANFNINNCDILHDEGTNPNGNIGFINAMLYSPASIAADINNFNVNNIYFDTPVLRFLDIRNDRGQIMGSPPATYALPWVYRNFNFSNIYFKQTLTVPLIYLHGYSTSHPMVNATFQNFYLNNTKVPVATMSDSTFFNQHRISGVVIK